MNQDLAFYLWFLRWLQVATIITCALFAINFRYPHYWLTHYTVLLDRILAALCLGGWTTLLGVKWGKYLMLDEVHHLEQKLEVKISTVETFTHNLSIREKEIQKLKDDISTMRIENNNLKELNQKIARTSAQANKTALQKLVGGQP